MKLAGIQDVDSESTETLEKIEFGLDDKSLALIFKSFTDSLYSNKPGSIVREITSNAVDAHAMTGVTRPVLLTMKDVNPLSGTPGKISFKDYGPGMSPDVIRNTYSKYFSSTKRDSNDEIGGWGIGAKTPLSFSNAFVLETISDGIKYTYMVHRGEAAPVIELVEKESTTDVGTEVIITIDKEDDVAVFKREIKNQLKYFDNIYYHNCDMDNEYTLYQGDNFIYRQEADESSNSTVMDISLGRVRYPIDWNQLGLGSSDYELPIAVRFEIGDLDVTLNREALEYTDKTKKNILNRIELFRTELAQMVQDQNPVYTDLKAYYEKSKQPVSVKFSERYIPVGSFIDGQTVGQQALIFQPVADLGLRMPTDPFFFFKSNSDIVGGKRQDRTLYGADKYVLQRLVDGQGFAFKVGKASERISTYINDEINSVVWFLENKINDEWWEDLTKVSDALTRLGIKQTDPNQKDKVQQFVDVMTQEAWKFALDYDAVEPTEEWMEQWLESRNSLDGLRGDKSTITCRELITSSNYSGDSKYFKMREVSLGDLVASYGKSLIIYGDAEDEEALHKAYEFLSKMGNTVMNGRPYLADIKKRCFRVIKVARDNIKLFGYLKTAVDIQDFNKHFQKAIIRMSLSQEIQEFFESKHFENAGLSQNIYGYDEAIEVLKGFQDSNLREGHTSNYGDISRAYAHGEPYVHNLPRPDGLDYDFVFRGKVFSIREILSYLYGVVDATPLFTHIRHQEKPNVWGIRKYLTQQKQRLNYYEE